MTSLMDFQLNSFKNMGYFLSIPNPSLVLFAWVYYELNNL